MAQQTLCRKHSQPKSNAHTDVINQHDFKVLSAHSPDTRENAVVYVQVAPEGADAEDAAMQFLQPVLHQVSVQLTAGVHDPTVYTLWIYSF